MAESAAISGGAGLARPAAAAVFAARYPRPRRQRRVGGPPGGGGAQNRVDRPRQRRTAPIVGGRPVSGSSARAGKRQRPLARGYPIGQRDPERAPGGLIRAREGTPGGERLRGSRREEKSSGIDRGETGRGRGHGRSRTHREADRQAGRGADRHTGGREGAVLPQALSAIFRRPSRLFAPGPMLNKLRCVGGGASRARLWGRYRRSPVADRACVVVACEVAWIAVAVFCLVWC